MTVDGLQTEDRVLTGTHSGCVDELSGEARAGHSESWEAWRQDARKFWQEAATRPYSDPGGSKGQATLSALLQESNEIAGRSLPAIIVTRRFPGDFYLPLLDDIANIVRDRSLLILITQPNQRRAFEHERLPEILRKKSWVGAVGTDLQSERDDTFFVIDSRRCRRTWKRGTLYRTESYLRHPVLCAYLTSKFMDMLRTDEVKTIIGQHILQEAQTKYRLPVNMPALSEDERWFDAQSAA